MTLHRPPRQPVDWAPRTDRGACRPIASQPRRSTGGLLGGVMSMVGGVVLALVMGHPMYLIFSAVGFAAAVVSALGTSVIAATAPTHRRDRNVIANGSPPASPPSRRPRSLINGPRRRRSPPRCGLSVTSRPSCGRGGPEHPDGFTVSLGWGTMAWSAVVDCSPGELSTDAEAIVERHWSLDDVPVTTSSGPAGPSPSSANTASPSPARCSSSSPPSPARRLASRGRRRRPGRSGSGPRLPARRRVTAPTSGPLIVAADGWQPGGRPRCLDDGDGRHVVVVTDRPDLLSTRTGALRRFLAAAPSVAVIAIVPPGGVVPPLCRSELRIGSLCAGRWTPIWRRRRSSTGSTPPACPSPSPTRPLAGSPDSTIRRTPTRRRARVRRR